MNIQRLKAEIRGIEDPRRQWGNLRHKLEDIVIIGLCTLLCGGEDFDDMEEFGKERKEWLSEFLELPNGIPNGDTFRRVYERLESSELSKCLSNWLEVEREKRAIIAIDGKTICGSKSSAHKAFHVVSAWAVENQITLGELAVDEKSNEITAVPKLLDLINVEGAIVTADAMSCQKKIALKIIEKQADYVIGLKGNQGDLRDDVEFYFTERANIPKTVTSNKGHGRIEQREYFLETEIDWLWQKPDWAGLSGIGMVKSTVEKKGEAYEESRYFITSLTNLDEFARAVREHWSIENHLHWCLDVIFREDASRARKDNSPLNMNVIRKMALFLLKNADFGRKVGIRKKMLIAALNPDRLFQVLFQK